MKAIIKGKRYDTETATKIAEWSSAHNITDFHYYCEALFHTRKGSWFLYGEGNYSSPYNGAKIVPLTPNEAQSWLESHDFSEEIEQYFPDEIEDA